ncbi:MAG TPA: hypothetical protein PKV55_13165, partial [Nitrospira sp.]|nr:hypothetical protein [Nitrospira sp.]
MSDRMNRRWYRMGFVSLVALIVLCAVTGSGATEPDGWMQRFEAGVKAREAARYAEAEPILMQVLREAEQGGADDARVALAANQLGLLYHD